GASAPAMQEKRVVLPAPFGPMMPKMSPRMTSKSTEASARSPPKRFEIARAERMASGGIEDPPDRRQSAPDSYDAVRLIEHHDDQQSAIDEQEGVAQQRNREELDLQRAEDQRAENRADDRSQAAEDRHEDDAEAEAKVENRRGCDVLEVDRV